MRIIAIVILAENMVGSENQRMTNTPKSPTLLDQIMEFIQAKHQTNFITMIGNGSFGSVYLAEHARDGRVFAVKVVEKARVLERGTAHNLLAERRSLEVCAGAAFITQLHSSFQVAAECRM